MREIQFKDVELEKLLEKRNKIVLAGRKEDEERQKLEESINKRAMELQKIDGKATEILKKKNLELTIDPKNKVFEQMQGAALKDGKIVITIADRVQDFVDALAKQLKEAEETKKKSEEVETITPKKEDVKKD